MRLPCFPAPPATEFRTVYANQFEPIGDGVGVSVVETHKHYADNVVVTSKYKLWNFVPKNLFEQFRRIANFYFLCVVIVQFSIRDRTPVSPATSLLPLVFVIFVTAVKQGYEDWRRHRADKEVNDRPAIILKDGKENTVTSKEIRVGDIVKVQSDDEIPCDLVVISSSVEDGMCYIMTANLDGETNLKTRQSLPQTCNVRSEEQLCDMHARIECDHPEFDMYKFNGRMIVGDAETYSLGLTNLLLRGSKLKNTEYAYGVAVYTGRDTKMAKNQKEKTAKFSTVEKSMNTYLLVFLLVLLIFTVTCTILKISWEKKHGNQWYLLAYRKTDAGEVMVNLFSFLVLFNYIIPISLYVTVEVQKFCGAMFFNWDVDIYHEPTDEPAVANTSDLNEELGQIEFIFSDKTGTLTENEMVFRRCSINGVRLIENVVGDEGKLVEDGGGEENNKNKLKNEITEFLTALAVCHTVQADEAPIKDNDLLPPKNKYIYQAASPDEKALCEVAARNGVTYTGKVGDDLVLDINGKTEKYKILHILDFDPTRKRMSIIVENRKQITMYCKGAESHVAPNCTSGPNEETLKHIDEYAEIGLRTLMICSRQLKNQEYEEIDKKLDAAQKAIGDREEQLAAVFNEVERGFHILGATAVEDNLQENVKETMVSLREAGLKVWVLTGDKQQTAVNISHSCGHFRKGMQILYLTQNESGTKLKESLEKYKTEVNKAGGKEYAVVVNGSSLVPILDKEKNEFLQVAEKCVAVLCCRMSPLQKAQVVRLVKQSKSKPITLAIGDGANDCSMIQEAHVGCGIMGKEGRQAVRCSDYAFHRFHFLKRVLFVHGHYFYIRLANTVQYFFYKNIAFILPQFLYQFYNGYSTLPLYYSLFLTAFNIFFVSLPVLFYGIFEKDIKDEYLMSEPKLYQDMAKNKNLSWRQFFIWSIAGLWHGIVMYIGTKELYGLSSFNKNMLDYGYYTYGTFVFTLVVIITNLKMAIIIHYWTWFMHLFVWGSILLYILTVIVFCGFVWPWPWLGAFNLSIDLDLYNIIYMLFDSGMFWFGTILIISVAILPDLICTVLSRYFYPTETQRYQDHRLETNIPIFEPCCKYLGMSPQKMYTATRNASDEIPMGTYVPYEEQGNTTPNTNPNAKVL